MDLFFVFETYFFWFLGKGFWKFGHHFFKGLSNLGHFRTSRKEGVENGQKIRTSFMDGPFLRRG